MAEVIQRNDQLQVTQRSVLADLKNLIASVSSLGQTTNNAAGVDVTLSEMKGIDARSLPPNAWEQIYQKFKPAINVSSPEFLCMFAQLMDEQNERMIESLREQTHAFAERTKNKKNNKQKKKPTIGISLL